MISLFIYVVVCVCFGMTHGAIIEFEDCLPKCPFRLDPQERYCCFDETGQKYCCKLIEFAATYLIIAVVVGIVISIISSLVCCLCCPCCFFYKRRHSGKRKKNAAAPIKA